MTPEEELAEKNEIIEKLGDTITSIKTSLLISFFINLLLLASLLIRLAYFG